MRKEHKNPKGGLTAKGRAYFKRKEGANLKPPVKRGVNPRRISFAARFAGMIGIRVKNVKKLDRTWIGDTINKGRHGYNFFNISK